MTLLGLKDAPILPEPPSRKEFYRPKNIAQALGCSRELPPASLLHEYERVNLHKSASKAL